MSSRKTGTIPLDKNYLFLNTKGHCLLCYDECPVQTLEKRRETTQTSVNFTRLVSRYLDFNIDNVIASPLKKVGRKCVIDKEQQNGKKIDKVGFELCSRCEALAHAFCEVQFQINFHQMILDRCVRSISEIIKDANKKSTAELFTLSEDDGSIKKQQKTFTRLTLGGLRSASMLRNKLYKKSLQKLSKSFPMIKLKRISKSGDWIPFLRKQENKAVSKTLPIDSKDVIFSSLLGCVVSFWIVLSLSFINPQEYAQKVSEEKSQPKSKMLVPLPLINCDELEIELKFPLKKKSAPQDIQPPPAPKRPRGRPPSALTAQQRSQKQTSYQPVVIHKHSNQIVQIQRPLSGSQYKPSESAIKEMEHAQSDLSASPSSKPKSTKYPTLTVPIPPTTPPKTIQYSPVRVSGISTSPQQSSSAPAHQLAYPVPHYPQQYPAPALPPPLQQTPPFAAASSQMPYNSTYAYPSATSSSSSSSSPIASPVNPPPLTSNVQDYHQQYSNSLNGNHNMSSNGYNYSYNFTTFNYNSSSTWPSSYNSGSIDPVPPPPYSAHANGGYDTYDDSANQPGRNDMHDPTSYNYGYDYSNYVPSSQPSSSPYQYQQQNGPMQYMSHSAVSMPGGGDIYSGAGGNGYSNDSSDTTSYTTLLPPVSKSSSYIVDVPSTAPSSMDIDATNTSTSDEPSLTHEDPQSLDSENSSMNGDDQIMDNENGSGGQQPSLMFPEFHWRQNQQADTSLISCKQPGCTEQFLTQGQLQLHLRTHGEFQCSFCHLTFSKAHNLAHHEKMRHCKSVGLGNRSKCPRCDFTSTSQYKYFLHFLTNHLGIAVYDKPCLICNKPFILGTKSINRKNHFRYYHDVDGKDPSAIFSCNGCNAPFLKEAQLRDHRPNCTAIASVSSSTSSVEEITYNTALATADQIVI